LARARGLCDGHYKRWLQRRPLDGGLAPRVKGGVRCQVPGCERHGNLRGLCQEHRRRVDRHGDVLAHIPIGEWRLGRYVNKDDGYRYIWLPEHPNARKSGYVAEHRLVMAEHLGRPLLAHETVHHLNRDRLDNRLENLELWTAPPVSGARPADLVEYAVEVLRCYAPDRLQG